jgi:DNA-binding MarR family transcriptional regulator
VTAPQRLDPAQLDLPTLAAIAGEAANRHLLGRLHAAGFDGIRISHGYIVQRLVDGEPTVGELAEQLGITQQAVSKSVAELESLGYVTRRPDVADSRVRRVALSERGRAMLAQGRADRKALEKRVSGDVSAAKSALVALLDATGELPSVQARRVRPSAD